MSVLNSKFVSCQRTQDPPARYHYKGRTFKLVVIGVQAGMGIVAWSYICPNAPIATGNYLLEAGSSGFAAAPCNHKLWLRAEEGCWASWMRGAGDLLPSNSWKAIRALMLPTDGALGQPHAGYGVSACARNCCWCRTAVLPLHSCRGCTRHPGNHSRRAGNPIRQPGNRVGRAGKRLCSLLPAGSFPVQEFNDNCWGGTRGLCIPPVLQGHSWRLPQQLAAHRGAVRPCSLCEGVRAVIHHLQGGQRGGQSCEDMAPYVYLMPLVRLRNKTIFNQVPGNWNSVTMDAALTICSMRMISEAMPMEEGRAGKRFKVPFRSCSPMLMPSKHLSICL